MNSARNRLMREFREVSKSPIEGVRLSPDEDNIMKWTAVIEGPSDTPYEGGKWHIIMHPSEQYPMAPPTARFLTKIFHPNVHWKTGEICMDILKTQWSPAWTLQSLCQAIRALMSDSFPDSPLNCDAGNLLRAGDTRGYNSMARLYTEEYAKEGGTHYQPMR